MGSLLNTVMRYREIIAEQTEPASRDTSDLRAAIRFDGKVYSSPGTHMDALDTMPPGEKRRAMSDGDNRGFVTRRGRFLDRFQAARFARQKELWGPNTPEWVITSQELTSENLHKFGR